MNYLIRSIAVRVFASLCVAVLYRSCLRSSHGADFVAVGSSAYQGTGDFIIATDTAYIYLQAYTTSTTPEGNYEVYLSKNGSSVSGSWGFHVNSAHQIDAANHTGGVFTEAYAGGWITGIVQDNGQAIFGAGSGLSSGFVRANTWVATSVLNPGGSRAVPSDGPYTDSWTLTIDTGTAGSRLNGFVNVTLGTGATGHPMTISVSENLHTWRNVKFTYFHNGSQIHSDSVSGTNPEVWTPYIGSVTDTFNAGDTWQVYIQDVSTAGSSPHLISEGSIAAEQLVIPPISVSSFNDPSVPPGPKGNPVPPVGVSGSDATSPSPSVTSAGPSPTAPAPGVGGKDSSGSPLVGGSGGGGSNVVSVANTNDFYAPFFKALQDTFQDSGTTTVDPSKGTYVDRSDVKSLAPDSPSDTTDLDSLHSQIDAQTDKVNGLATSIPALLPTALQLPSAGIGTVTSITLMFPDPSAHFAPAPHIFDLSPYLGAINGIRDIELMLMTTAFWFMTVRTIRSSLAN